MMTHPLLPKLRQLRLSGMVHSLDLRAAQAIERQLGPTEFLALLLDDELERRSQTRLARRLANAREELRRAPEFDAQVVNDVLDQAGTQTIFSLLRAMAVGEQMANDAT